MGRSARAGRADGIRGLNVQVFGFRDCQDTRKALRFFSERRIAVHFVDLREKPASKGELRRFSDRYGAAALIDKASPRFKALGLHVSGDSPQRQVERALVEPRLLKTPLVRIDQKVSIGYQPDDWATWTKGDTA